MSMLLHQTWFELKNSLRDRGQLLMSWGFPLMFFLMVGTLMTQVVPGYRDQVMASMILFSMLSSSLLSLPSVWIQAREQGILRTWKINGIRKGVAMLAPVLAALVNLAILALLIVVLSVLLFQSPWPRDWPGFLAGVSLAAIMCSSLGLLIGTIAANARVGILLGQVLYLPGLMLGGLMFPASLLPPELATVARVLPATWAMRGIQEQDSLAWLVMAGVSLVASLVSIAVFEWHANPEKPLFWRWAALLILVPGMLGLLA